MAQQRRMLSTNIWQNEELARLDPYARLLYIGMITFADDEGRLKGNALLLKSTIFPLDKNVTDEKVRKWINEIFRAKLITVYKVEGQYFIQHPNWEKYQTLRSDRAKMSDIPAPNTENIPNGRQKTTKSRHKLREVKIREDKGSEVPLKRTIKYLENFPESEALELSERYEASVGAIKSKADDLANYCKSHGRRYNDYRAFLMVALKKDFGLRKIPKVKTEYREVLDEKGIPRIIVGMREELAAKMKMK